MDGSTSQIDVTKFVENKNIINVTNLSEEECKNY